MTTPHPHGRLLDWRFLVALTVLILTTTLCWAVTKRINQGDDLVKIAAASADHVAVLNRQLGVQNTQATKERALLAAQIRGLKAQNDALAKVLRAHGFAVPKPVSVPSGGTPSPVQHPGKGHGGGKGSKPGHPKPTTHPTPSPTPPPMIDLTPLCELVPMVGCVLSDTLKLPLVKD